MSRRDPLRDVLCLDLTDAGQIITTRRTFPAVAEKVDHLQQLAARDGARGAVCLLGDELETPDAVQAWIQRRIRYVSDETQGGEVEILKAPRVALAQQDGDCEDHAALCAALLIGAGYVARIVTIGGSPDDPAHAVAAWWDPYSSTRFMTDPPRWLPFGAPLPPWWAWAETTIAAELGEDPFHAAQRLDLLARLGG